MTAFAVPSSTFVNLQKRKNNPIKTTTIIIHHISFISLFNFKCFWDYPEAKEILFFLDLYIISPLQNFVNPFVAFFVCGILKKKEL